jgi:hypothetical protein
VLIVKPDKPSLADGLNGGWLVSAVAFQADAGDEGSFASRTQPDGGHSQRETTAATELLSQPEGYRLRRFHASALSLQANYHLLHLLQR